MHFKLITLFPGMFESLQYGIVGRALEKGLIQFQCYNPRDFTEDKHHHVDDRPYGGGAGMVMMAEPLQRAMQRAKQDANGRAHVVYLSPQGKTLTHEGVCELQAKEQLILLCGRYEGIDERVLIENVDEEWSIGDYVLSGGEFAAMVMIDCITRLIPGALGSEDSASADSFATGILDHSHYTRPEVWNGMPVPTVLLSGDHAAIKRWRLQQALTKTWQQRPDLLEKLDLTKEQQNLLQEIRKESK